MQPLPAWCGPTLALQSGVFPAPSSTDPVIILQHNTVRSSSHEPASTFLSPSPPPSPSRAKNIVQFNCKCEMFLFFARAGNQKVWCFQCLQSLDCFVSFISHKTAEYPMTVGVGRDKRELDNVSTHPSDPSLPDQDSQQTVLIL